MRLRYVTIFDNLRLTPAFMEALQCYQKNPDQTMGSASFGIKYYFYCSFKRKSTRP